MPVTTLVHYFTGATFSLARIVGVGFGIACIPLAWGFGRIYLGKTFGLLLAALLSVSLLHIAWSNMGGLFITGLFHVLLVLCVMFAVLAGLYLQSDSKGLLTMFWPQYPGYVGNRGETSLIGLVEINFEPVVFEIKRSLYLYFVSKQNGIIPDVRSIGFFGEYGGLCLFPVALVGLIGLGIGLYRWKRYWQLLAIAVAGFAIPILSVTSARRFILFDFAWCAFIDRRALFASKLNPRFPVPELERCEKNTADIMLEAFKAFLGL